jgi:membrane peptidoglycan carboxypeptidase
MTNYLNLIYLGENSNGVAAAAQTYFGEPVSNLTIAQDAVIAGIIQQPSTFPLESNRAALKARWTYVLQQMLADNYITQAQLNSAKFPTMLTDKNGSASSGTSINSSKTDPWAPYVMAQVENELTGIDGISQQQLETGGMKVVTTISKSMENQMYKSVGDNLDSESIRNTSGATVTSLPAWALVGAELQDPKTGQIIAEYPGKGQGLPSTQCKVADCDVNTAVYAREQVGSSFKPYVLATAVGQGMNVKTSTLNASTELCVPPDSKPMVLSSVVPYPATKCSQPDYFPVSNDGGEVIGTAKKGGGTTVQNALAQSSNTAFSDLAHRVGTSNIATMAGNFGVDLAPYGGQTGGSGLKSYIGEVGMALGIAPLTVNEQTTMLSTIADNGLYHQAHVIKYWQQDDGSAKQTPKIDSHIVLNPDLDAQVQYAMEQTTINGTAAATVTYGQQAPGTVIGKTGTTTNSHSGFFIGSTTQYTLVVGMFTSSGDTNSNDNLSALGGGGFGGYWPAKIWNSFAESAFSPSPTLFSTSPTFTGTAWNQVGKLPPQKPVCTKTSHGHKVHVQAKGCPNVNPTPTPTCQYQGDPTCGPGGFQTPTPSDTCQFQGDPTCGPGGFQTPTPSDTCQFQGDPNCTNGGNNGNGNGNNGPNSTTPTATATQAGLAVGGGLMLLPGSLVWRTISRRRRRKGRAHTAE